MNIYFVVLVDAVENELLMTPTFVIAKTEQDAGAQLSLTEAHRKGISKGDYQLVIEQIASYEPVEISFVRSK